MVHVVSHYGATGSRMQAGFVMMGQSVKSLGHSLAHRHVHSNLATRDQHVLYACVQKSCAMSSNKRRGASWQRQGKEHCDIGLITYRSNIPKILIITPAQENEEDIESFVMFAWFGVFPDLRACVLAAADTNKSRLKWEVGLSRHLRLVMKGDLLWATILDYTWCGHLIGDYCMVKRDSVGFGRAFYFKARGKFHASVR